MEVFKKLLLLLLIIPNLGFAEKYDSQYYKDWIEGECIEQSFRAANDFIAKKIYQRCEKASIECIAKTKKLEPDEIMIQVCKEEESEGRQGYAECIAYVLPSWKRDTYKKCMKDEIGWQGSNSPMF